MLHIIVYGFPKTSQAKLNNCCEAIKSVSWKAPGVIISSHQVVVSFPIDQLNVGLGEEILAYVYGVETTSHFRPTKEQKDDLCVSLAAVLREYKPRNCIFIQVRTCSFDLDWEGLCRQAS